MVDVSKPRVLRQVVLGWSLAAASVLSLAAQPPGERGAGPAPHTQGGHMGGGLPQGPMLDRLLDDVKARPEQREQIRKISQAAQPEGKAERETARATQDQLMQAFVNADPKAAEAARQQMMARHDTATKRHVQVLQDVAKVLTPEQRKQLAEKMKRHGDAADGRGHDDHGPGGRGDAPAPQDKPRR